MLLRQNGITDVFKMVFGAIKKVMCRCQEMQIYQRTVRNNIPQASPVALAVVDNDENMR